MTEQVGVCCPNCDSRLVPVQHTERISDRQTKRYRRCCHCGRRFKTYEWIKPPPESITPLFETDPDAQEEDLPLDDEAPGPEAFDEEDAAGEFDSDDLDLP
jgi:hypothetical protein